MRKTVRMRVKIGNGRIMEHREWGAKMREMEGEGRNGR